MRKDQKSLDTPNSGGWRSAKDPWTTTDRLEVSRTGRSSKIQSKSQNDPSSMTKFKELQTKVEVHGN